MELIKAYPVIFLLTVVLPFAGGLVGAYLGWDALNTRVKNEDHRTKVESQLTDLDRKLAPLADQIATLHSYEQALARANERDQVLSAVLVQYERMKFAVDALDRMRGKGKASESEELAKNILDMIRSDLNPIRVDPNLPGHPLIIRVGANFFRILFAVPMRIPPKLEFSGLPNGVNANVVENSRFGFSVTFVPLTIEVGSFGFTADSEL
ncbi:MAG: hypothetical protein CAF43_005755 [Nitrospira sp. CG24C]|jgi:hypothetical protein|nr:MAG: hypothetical protein CAF43_005755 [Nitrospira sp. CG24C]TKB52293.1 MAG: hypothetical protein E8D50_10670 [Nitrospira sp.]